MRGDPRRARDLALLDLLDPFARESIETDVWRVTREGREPTSGGPSRSRWCNGSFDVLYTSFERDGAIAEIHALLSMQPVFPSKMRWVCSKLRVGVTQALNLADLPTLERLGVETARYRDRRYGRTQDIADAAYFLGFDGLIAPSARWPCANLVIFTDRVAPGQIEVLGEPGGPICWADWQRRPRPTL